MVWLNVTTKMMNQMQPVVGHIILKQFSHFKGASNKYVCTQGEGGKKIGQFWGLEMRTKGEGGSKILNLVRTYLIEAP